MIDTSGGGPNWSTWVIIAVICVAVGGGWYWWEHSHMAAIVIK